MNFSSNIHSSISKLAALLVVVSLTAALVGCGSDESSTPGLAGDDSSTCVVADVSGSTKYVREDYVEVFRQEATNVGEHGSGKLCLAFAATKSTESPVEWATVGAENPNSTWADSEIEDNVNKATAQFSSWLAIPPVKAKRSAILDALSSAAQELKPGDRLVGITDGIENGSFGSFSDPSLLETDAKISALLDEIDRAGYLPSLNGISFSMPMLTVLRKQGTRLDGPALARVKKFWVTYARRCGTTLTTSPTSVEP